MMVDIAETRCRNLPCNGARTLSGSDSSCGSSSGSKAEGTDSHDSVSSSADTSSDDGSSNSSSTVVSGLVSMASGSAAGSSAGKVWSISSEGSGDNLLVTTPPGGSACNSDGQGARDVDENLGYFTDGCGLIVELAGRGEPEAPI